MQKKYLKGGLSATTQAVIVMAALASGRVSARTMDVAYGYRCPAGYAGDINRAHPFSVEPVMQNASTPVLQPGMAVIIDTATNTGRQAAAGDTALTRIYGIAAREYPVQQTSGGPTANIGVATLPTNRPMSVLRSGYQLVYCNGTPTKDGVVYLWIAASSGNHVQGAFEASATGGSTIAVANAKWNGPGDSAGIAELVIWPS